MSEKDLIKACQNNNRKAQEMLYRKYFVLVKSICLRYTHDEDKLISIINDSFLKIFKGIQKYQATGSFEGWIRRTSFNALSDYFRKDNRYTKVTSFEIPEQSHNSEAIEDLYYADLLDIVNTLPPTTQTVFKKYAIEGYTHKEIGDSLGFSDGTSKWHLFEARKKLKNILKNRDLKVISNVG